MGRSRNKRNRSRHAKFIARFPGHCWYCSRQVLGMPCGWHEGELIHLDCRDEIELAADESNRDTPPGDPVLSP